MNGYPADATDAYVIRQIAQQQAYVDAYEQVASIEYEDLSDENRAEKQE